MVKNCTSDSNTFCEPCEHVRRESYYSFCVFIGGSVVDRLGRWTCNPEARSSSPALTGTGICPRQSRVQILGHACKIANLFAYCQLGLFPLKYWTGSFFPKSPIWGEDIQSTPDNSRVRVTEGKITVNVRGKSRGNRLWFDLARGSKQRGFELSGVNCIDKDLDRLKLLFQDLFIFKFN